MSSGTDQNAPLPSISSVETTFRGVNGVNLHVVAAGDPEDPIIVLLHGFPEFWYQWRRYIPSFVDAGYRVLVPDQRGYNRSDKPTGVNSYRINELSQDILELVGTEDSETAHIVGHDWGAFVGWDLALRYPEAVNRLSIINVPHPRVFEQLLRTNLTQLHKSWYMFLFQLPDFSESVIRRNDFEFLVAEMQGGSRSGTFSQVDFERYRRSWSEEGALTAMLNWYRALFQRDEDPPREQVQTSTLIVWGEDDESLVPQMAPMSLDFCDDGRLERFSDATHWIHHEYPDRVSELVLDHLGA